MKKNKVFVSALLIMLMISSVTTNSFGKDISSMYYAKSVSDLKGLSEERYYADDIFDKKVSITDLFCSDKSIIIDEALMVEFVDIIGVMKNKTYVNLSSQVRAVFDNEEIAEYNKGRIKGLKSGKTRLTLSYGVLTCTVDVIVKNDVDSDVLSRYWSEEGASLKSIPGTGPGNVMSRAYAMKNVQWTAQRRFRLNDGSYAAAGTVLKGVPYSKRRDQCNDSLFLSYYSNGLNNGFYDEHARGSYYDATYGVDCSGFVSFAWGVPRDTTEGFVSELCLSFSNKYEKIGTYTVTSSNSTANVDKIKLRNAYSLMTPSNAVVYRNNGVGHAMLVSSNNVSRKKCTFLEAYGNFPAEVTYTYQQLMNMGYCPFTVTETYYNTYNNR